MLMKSTPDDFRTSVSQSFQIHGALFTALKVKVFMKSWIENLDFAEHWLINTESDQTYKQCQ